jgi:hypothetical protein
MIAPRRTFLAPGGGLAAISDKSNSFSVWQFISIPFADRFY